MGSEASVVMYTGIPSAAARTTEVAEWPPSMLVRKPAGSSSMAR